MKNQIMIGMVAVGLMAGCATNEHENRDDGRMMNEGSGAASTPSIGTKFNELPAAVQKTVKENARGAKIDDIDKEMRTGRVVYEIQFAEPGKNPKLHIAEDGTLLKHEDLKENAATAAASIGTEFNELPVAVQKAVKSHAPDAKIDDIDKETRTGRVVYEIQFAEPGKNPKLHVAEDGSIVKGD